jgi:hypothetical protein
MPSVYQFAVRSASRCRANAAWIAQAGKRASAGCEGNRAQTRDWTRLEGSDDPYERAVLQALDANGPDALWAIVVAGVAELEELRLEAEEFSDG